MFLVLTVTLSSLFCDAQLAMFIVVVVFQLDQLHRHEHHVLELEHQLQLHLVAAPEKGSKSAVISLYIEKENFIQFEVRWGACIIPGEAWNCRQGVRSYFYYMC